MSRPSAAMVVALVALFVALAGVGVAATGGNFILGQENKADQTTSLSSDVASGPTLLVENNGGKPAARFNASGGPPLAVGNSKKIQNLNADQLDGIDSANFVRGGGTAGRARNSVPTSSGPQELLKLPDLAAIAAGCSSAGMVYGWVTNPTSSTIDIYTSTGHIALQQGAGINIGSWEGVRLVQVGQTRVDGFLAVAHVGTVALALRGGDPCRAQAQALKQP